MPNIVVIGGGFAGTRVAKRLEKQIPPDWHVVLISDENFMIYTPLLCEVAGASLLPGHALAPIRKMIRRTRYYRAQVEKIDLQQQLVYYRDRERDKTASSMPYEQLVLACGKNADIGFVDGMQDYALPLKTLGDALHIRNRIIVRLEQAELEDDPQRRRTLTTFIIVGGGASGVEVAGAIADFLSAAEKYYPRTQDLDSKVIVLEGGDRLVAEFPGSLGDSAQDSMRKAGIEIHLNSRVSEVTPAGVKTESGEWIRGGNVICTIGTVPDPLIQALDIAKQQGRIRTEPDMSLPGLKNVWAIGDCAAVVNAHDAVLSPPMAQFAVRQATQVADNIIRVLAGKSTLPFSYRSPGQVVSLGHRRAVAHVGSIKLSGFAAWLLWRAVYLSMLPTVLRKIQVFFEWNLDLLFPRDVTQLHMTRSGQAQDSDTREQQAGEEALSKHPPP